ncbi:TolC family protein [Mucilaginibacter sp.]|uniref:TolC family protein n=1 Tax=Mucilaginibacter sp. TaxID=1882438 RepID=UPI003D1307A2
MKQVFFMVSLLCAFALKGFSQQAPPDTLTYKFTVADCISYAYNHQHAVINAQLDVTSAEYHIKEIVGQGYPQINGSASFQDYMKIPTTLIPGEFLGLPAGTFKQLQFGVKYQSSFTIAANQILFDPNYIVGLQARKTYRELYARSFTRSEIDANVNVTKAYYQVLVSVEQLKLLEANIKEIKQQLDETVARNKQGFVEKIDVDRITVQYNSLVTNRENTVRLLGLNYQLLKFQMGMPIDKVLTLKDKLEDIQLDGSAALATSDTAVYHNRIEYNLLETQKKINEYDLKSKKGQFLPKLTANASYAASYQNNAFSNLYTVNFPSSYVGLSLSLPIFTGFQHLNQVKQSKITVLKSQNDLEDMKNTVNLQVSQSRIAYINGLQTLNDQRKNMALAEEVLRVSKIKYEQGVGSSIEVTQAQTAVQEADNSYIQGLYDALVSKVDLDKAYGRIK